MINSCTILKILLWLKTYFREERTAAPQLDISKRIIATLVPQSRRCRYNPPKKPIAFKSHVQLKVVAHSVSRCNSLWREAVSQQTCNVPGYGSPCLRDRWVFHKRWGKETHQTLKGWQPIVVQHEIDHTNGKHDRINPVNPFEIKEGLFDFRIAYRQKYPTEETQLGFVIFCPAFIWKTLRMIERTMLIKKSKAILGNHSGQATPTRLVMSYLCISIS